MEYIQYMQLWATDCRVFAERVPEFAPALMLHCLLVMAGSRTNRSFEVVLFSELVYQIASKHIQNHIVL